MQLHIFQINVLLTLFSLTVPPLANAADKVLEERGECVTAGAVPCNPAGSVAGATPPESAFGGSGFWGSLEGAASTPIQVKREVRRDLVERQNALCCRPAPVECLVIEEDDVPFCYVSPYAHMREPKGL